MLDMNDGLVDVFNGCSCLMMVNKCLIMMVDSCWLMVNVELVNGKQWWIDSLVV